MPQRHPNPSTKRIPQSLLVPRPPTTSQGRSAFQTRSRIALAATTDAMPLPAAGRSVAPQCHRGPARPQGAQLMPIRPELRPLYPANWRALSRWCASSGAGDAARSAGGRMEQPCTVCPTAAGSIPFAASGATAGASRRWPDLIEALRLRTTRVVLAAAHLDHNHATTGAATCGGSASAATCCTTDHTTWRSAGSLTGGAGRWGICSWDVTNRRGSSRDCVNRQMPRAETERFKTSPNGSRPSDKSYLGRSRCSG